MNSLKKISVVALALLGIAFTNTSSSFAAAYIKYDGIEGEALGTASDPQDGIDLGIPSPRLASLVRTSDGAGTLTFSRDRDSASRLLARWAREDRRFTALQIYLPDRRGEGYRRYKLGNVRFSNHTISTGTDRQPAEEVVILFQFAVYEGRED